MVQLIKASKINHNENKGKFQHLFLMGIMRSWLKEGM